MIELTQSLQRWLAQNYPDLIGLIMLGHMELFTEKMAAEYVTWCRTEEGRQYLKGGAKYQEEQYAGGSD